MQFGNCSTTKVPRFCRFTGFTKMQLTLLLDGRSVLDKLFFKMKFKECFISWCWSHTLLIIFVGFTALQTSGLFKKQKNQICSYNNNFVTKDKFITFGASQALGASDPAQWRPQVHMKLTLTLSVTISRVSKHQIKAK